MIVKLKIEDRRSKVHSFECGSDNRIILKSIYKSQSKDTEFEEEKKGLDGDDRPKESDKYILRSLNH